MPHVIDRLMNARTTASPPDVVPVMVSNAVNMEAFLAWARATGLLTEQERAAWQVLVNARGRLAALLDSNPVYGEYL